MTTCGPPDAAQLVAERLANYLDCQSQSLATNGFGNLSGGWLGPALLATGLTIYVALLGYRLILGATIGPREAVLTAVRAGVVLAFATSWSAYETVIYRVAVDGPSEVASQLLSTGAAAPSLTDAAGRLDAAYATIQASGAYQSRSPPPSPYASASANLPATVVTAPATGKADPIIDRTWFLLIVIVVGSLGALKLAAGLLLGSGPLFITLGLFDATLGVLQGWIRGLLALFVATMGGVCLTAMQLDFVEAQLTAPAAGQAIPLSEPILMAAAVLFAIAMAVILLVAFVVGSAFRFTGPTIERSPQTVRAAESRQSALSTQMVGLRPLQPLDRAQSVADAVRRLGQRERAMAAPLAVTGASDRFRPVGSRPGPSPSTSARTDARELRFRRTVARARTPSIQRRDDL